MVLLFCASIVPLPVGIYSIPGFSNSDPFPCQGSVCGCKTARQCWTDCCCHTPRERSLWAVKNQVDPPAYAVLDDSSEPIQDLCTLEELRALVESRGLEDASCHRTNSLQIDSNPLQKKTIGKNTSIVKLQRKVTRARWILALRCRSQSGPFTSIPWAVIPHSSATQIEWLIAFDPLLFLDLRSFGEDREPDTPPPRRLSRGSLIA